MHGAMVKMFTDAWALSVTSRATDTYLSCLDLTPPLGRLNKMTSITLVAADSENLQAGCQSSVSIDECGLCREREGTYHVAAYCACWLRSSITGALPNGIPLCIAREGCMSPSAERISTIHSDKIRLNIFGGRGTHDQWHPRGLAEHPSPHLLPNLPSSRHPSRTTLPSLAYSPDSTLVQSVSINSPLPLLLRLNLGAVHGLV